MAQAPNVMLMEGTRRILVSCTGALAAGAFTSLVYYAVTNLDSLGAGTITVEAVFAISGDPNSFELQIDSDVTQGALYQLALTALPFADSSTFTGAITAQVTPDTNGPIVNSEPAVSDAQLQVFQRDLAQSSTGDFMEDPTGDLATITGRPNWLGAMNRRFGSAGVLWDVNYGSDADDYVNAPGVMAMPYSAKIVSQARADDRTQQASVDVISDANSLVGVYYFQVSLTSRDNQDPVAITLPLPLNT